MKSMRTQKDGQRHVAWMRRLMQQEAMIGGQLFGPVEPGRRREFFCLDEHTWIWHEEWTDEHGQHNAKTTRYDIRPDNIIKSQNGQYMAVTLEEADRLCEAATQYRARVRREVYGLPA